MYRRKVPNRHNSARYHLVTYDLSVFCGNGDNTDFNASAATDFRNLIHRIYGLPVNFFPDKRGVCVKSRNDMDAALLNPSYDKAPAPKRPQVWFHLPFIT